MFEQLSLKVNNKTSQSSSFGNRFNEKSCGRIDNCIGYVAKVQSNSAVFKCKENNIDDDFKVLREKVKIFGQEVCYNMLNIFLHSDDEVMFCAQTSKETNYHWIVTEVMSVKHRASCYTEKFQKYGDEDVDGDGDMLNRHNSNEFDSDFSL